MPNQSAKDFVLSYCPNARVEKIPQNIKNGQDHRWVIKDAWPHVNVAWGNTENQAWKNAKVHVQLELSINKQK